jgi:hypothetical protein
MYARLRERSRKERRSKKSRDLRLSSPETGKSWPRGSG